MIIIEYIDDCLILSLIKQKFMPRHRRQLDYWGFTWDEDTGCFIKQDNIEKDLLKVIKYIEKVNMKYSLTNSCKTLVEGIQSKNNKFQEIIESGRNFKNGNYNKTNFSNHIDFLNKNIKRKLKNHQIKASFHLYLIRNGANFSVPGSGKTSVVLSVFERLRLQNKVNSLFVVGPTSSFGPWKREFEYTLGRKSKSLVLAGGDLAIRKNTYFAPSDNFDLYLTTFNTLLNDQEEVCVFIKNRNNSIFFIIDEAHYIKKIDGNWANAVLKASQSAKFRCILTGTPIPKSYSDLYNLFDILWPDNEPINQMDKMRLQACEEQKEFSAASEILEPLIGPLFYRVRKSDLGLKEQVFNPPEIINMNIYERMLYDAVVEKIKRNSKDDYLKNIDLVMRLRRGRMVRIRQCLSYAGLLSTALTNYDEELFEDENDLQLIISNYDDLESPAKLERLLEMVKNFLNKSEKVVIWAHFIGTIKLLEKRLNAEGINCKKIIGETPIEKLSINEAETREKIISEFTNVDSDLDILLANPAACAESISLHKACHNAIYYDLSYNAAQFLQSLDRIHRVGGSENQESYYYFLQYDETVEPKIFQNLDEKAKKMYAIIDGDFNIYSLDMFDELDDINVYEKLLIS